MSAKGTSERGPNGFDAVAIDAADNVATVLRAVAAGETIRVKIGNDVTESRLAEAIPFCHKVALIPIGAGAKVVKYGAPIGSAQSAIAAGTHVHVHNMCSDRVRPGETS